MPACKYCGSRTVKRGLRKTNLGRKQTYLCRKCKRKSTIDWPRMRFPQREVMHAVRLRKNGFSTSEVQRRMKEKGVKVSRWTIIKWERKFG